MSMRSRGRESTKLCCDFAVGEHNFDNHDVNFDRGPM